MAAGGADHAGRFAVRNVGQACLQRESGRQRRCSCPPRDP